MLIGQGTPERPTPCRRLYRVPGSRQSPFFFPQYYFSVFHDARSLLCYRHYLARATGHLHCPRCSCCLRLLRQWSSVPSIHPSHRSTLTHSPRALVFMDPWCGHHPFPARLGSRHLLRPSPLAQPTLGLLTPPSPSQPAFSTIGRSSRSIRFRMHVSCAEARSDVKSVKRKHRPRSPWTSSYIHS